MLMYKTDNDTKRSPLTRFHTGSKVILFSSKKLNFSKVMEKSTTAQGFPTW